MDVLKACIWEPNLGLWQLLEPGDFLTEVCCGLQISQEANYGVCLANSGPG